MEFVDEVPEYGRRGSKKWDDIAAALKEAAPRWGVLEEDAPPHRSQLARINLKGRGEFEVVYRRGTIYARAL